MKSAVAPFAKEILVMASLALEKLSDELQALYARDGRGRKPRDPVSMLQSLIMMNLEGQTSFTQWVKTTRTHPVMAVLCGFSPGDTPGVGTYLLKPAELPNPEDLQNRLQEYLREIALKPSAEKGLIQPDKLEVIGDGSIEPANQSDYTLSLKTLDRFLKAHPEFTLRNGTLDAGHDGC